MTRRVYPRTPDDDVLDRFYNLVASILTILGLRLGINEKNGNLMLLPLYKIPDQSSSIGSRKTQKEIQAYIQKQRNDTNKDRLS